MNLVKRILASLALLFCLSGLAFAQETLFAYVGAGIKEPVLALAEAFEKETGIKIEMTFNNSGALVSQLKLSKTGDIFMPGSLNFVAMAQKENLVSKVSDALAYHVPIILVPKGNPKNIKTVEDLAKPGINLILPDKEATALGKSAFKIFARLGISAAIEKNILSYGETPQKVILALRMGQGDAGIVDYSNGSKLADSFDMVEIDPKINEIEILPCAILSCSNKVRAAQKFYDFAVKHGAEAFAKYGFKSTL